MSRRPLTEAEVRSCLRAAILAAGGQRAWAERNGMSQGYVSKAVLGRRPPGDRVLAALGLRALPPAYAPAVQEDRS